MPSNGKTQHSQSAVVRIAGSPLALSWEDQLLRVTIDQTSGLPDAATLVFQDSTRELLDKTGIDIGSKLLVNVQTGSSLGPSLFNGEVTALELDYDHELMSYLVVRALCPTHRLHRNRRVLAHKGTAATIARTVITKAGLTPGKIDLEPITYSQLSQGGETDREFLTRLAAAHGATVRTDKLGRVVVAPPAKASSAPGPQSTAERSPFVLEYGENLRSIRATLTSSGQVKTVLASGWDPQKKQELQHKESVTAGSATMVAAGLSMATKLGRFSGPAQSIELETGQVFRTTAEVRAAARVLAGSISDRQAELEAVVSGNVSLRADTPIALTGVDKRFNGRYTATSVQHVLTPEEPYRCLVGVSATPDRSLAGLTAGQETPQAPRFPGVAVAVVTEVSGGGKTAPGGQVKLKFPWLDKDYVSDWVRVVQFGGVGGGGWVYPDVNDEVLVAFEQGLLDHPYLIGGLYNGRDKPKKQPANLVRAGKVLRRSLATRKDHRLEVIDDPAEPGVLLSSGDDQLKVQLNNQTRAISLTNERSRTSVELHRQGISLKNDASGTSLELGPNGIVIDSGARPMTLRGQSISLRGTMSVRINGARVDIN